MTKNANDKIIRKVKGLLALAEDKSNIEESQSAFLTAQRMMVKYGIDPSEVESTKKIREALTKNATEYKKLWWWERVLAEIISTNFRCEWYYHNKYLDGSVQKKRSIVFVGLEQDIELATEMYALASSAVIFYSRRYLKENDISGNRGETQQAKDGYIRGFLSGLKDKFKDQIEEQEWGLVLVVPEEVTEKKNEILKGAKSIGFKIPSLQSEKHYNKGYEEGNAIDYKRNTIK